MSLIIKSKQNLNVLFKAFILLLFLAACVPARKMEELQEKQKACETDLAAAKKSAQENEAKLSELKEQMTKNEKENVGLKRDTGIIGSSYRNLTGKYDKLDQLNQSLMDRLNKLLAGSERDNSKLSGDLQLTQDQLLKKQDELKTLELKLNQQKKDLDDLSAQLKLREARVNELENIIKQKDKATSDLKKKLSDALTSFEGKGLTITQKNGKVYVSMDESLLFASGKTNIEPRGVDALKNLAKVLETNTDINLMVEGHTDDVPMNGKGEIKDNWDLSVMRATSVTKIILNSAKIDGSRITSAGRGDFFPLDSSKTPEARKKNRRTELILTPKLDELFKILDNN
ncbi:MAG: OmpA family protein [Bacteroidetes bacterium]|nr:OmpA family protein [Bacteroidota bacterium]